MIYLLAEETQSELKFSKIFGELICGREPGRINCVILCYSTFRTVLSNVLYVTNPREQTKVTKQSTGEQFIHSN